MALQPLPNISEKPAILMLHGFFGNAANWRACAELLSQRWRVLVPPLPLFGVKHREDRIEHVLKFLAELFTAENLRRVVIIGNSLGGQIGVNFALRWPERVAGLVLTGSSGLYERNLTNKVQRRPEREWLRARIAEIFFDPRHATEEMVDEIHALLNDRQKAFEILYLAKRIREDSVRELLPKLRCPVSLIWGADDRITPPETAWEFQALLPKAELHFIPECGHAAMMEQPEKFCELAENFLRRLITKHFADNAAHTR
jgi:2-hydroxy-6-oxonona-2,4-dienedioate hydrolase